MSSTNSRYNRQPTLESLALSNANVNQALLFATQTEFNPDDILQEPQSALFESLLQHGHLVTATGFVEAEVMSLYQLDQPFIVTVRQPGSQPKSSWLDMLICFLSWLKLGVDYDALAYILCGITASHVEDNIKCIRPVLHLALFYKWLESLRCPVLLTGTVFPYHIYHALI